MERDRRQIAQDIQVPLMLNKNETPDELARELELLGDSIEKMLFESRKHEDMFRHEAGMLSTDLKFKAMVAETLNRRIRTQQDEHDRRTAELANKAKKLRSLLLKKSEGLKAFHEKLKAEIAVRETQLAKERRYSEDRSGAQAAELDRLNSELYLFRNRCGALEKFRQALLCRVAGLTEANEKLALFRKEQEKAMAALARELEKKEEDRILEAEKSARELADKSGEFRAASAMERESHKAVCEILEREAAAAEAAAREKLALFRKEQEQAVAALARELEKKEEDRILEAEKSARELVDRSGEFRAASAMERESHKAAYEKLEREAAAALKELRGELLALKEAARHKDAALDGLRAEFAEVKARQEILKAALETGQPDAVRMLEEVLLRKYVEMEKLEAEAQDLKTMHDSIKSGLESNLSEINEQSARVRSLLAGLKGKEAGKAPD